MAATCMAVCKGSRKKIRGIFISSCHLPVAVECDIVILSEPGPIPQAPVGQFCRHNLSPRGDGNLAGISSLKSRSGHNLSPRGDGNSIGSLPSNVRSDTTYPREGTETTDEQYHYICIIGHNLSPRGDGNHALKLIKDISDGTQLIPARGRKRRPRPGRAAAVG